MVDLFSYSPPPKKEKPKFVIEKMNEEVRDLWVGGLISGAYRHGPLLLRDNQDRYSVLGVLCDLASEENIGHWTVINETWHFVAPGDAYDVSCYILPTGVRRWAGLKSVSPLVEFRGEAVSISRLNDAFHQNFDQIASLIMEQL